MIIVFTSFSIMIADEQFQVRNDLFIKAMDRCDCTIWTYNYSSTKYHRIISIHQTSHHRELVYQCIRASDNATLSKSELFVIWVVSFLILMVVLHHLNSFKFWVPNSANKRYANGIKNHLIDICMLH